MVLTISGELKQDTLYPGEIVNCRIDFKNVAGKDDKKSTKDENIVWAVGQLYGVISADAAWIKLNTPPQQLKVGNYLPKIEESSRFIFYSSPSILLADLTLSANQSKTLLFSCTLPTDLPPSFSGTSVKYSYFVEIVIQSKLNQPLHTLRLPIRVLNPACSLEACSSVLSSVNLDFALWNPQSREIAPDFDWTKETGSRDMSLRDKNVRKTIHALFEKHANTTSINISKGEHHIVKFSIEKTAFQLGDTIRGLFDFSESNTTCQQISVTMVMEESVHQTALKPGRTQRTVHKTINEMHEYTASCVQTYLNFYIPIDLPQTFSTDVVSVTYTINIKLMVPSLTANAKLNEFEILEWSLPVKLLLSDMSQQYQAESSWNINSDLRVLTIE